MHSIGTPLLFRFIFCMEITCADRCAGSCVHWAAWNYLHSFFACIELSWEKTCALRALAGNLRDNYRQIRKHICAQRAECMWRSKWRYILHFHYKVSLWILVVDRCRVVLPLCLIVFDVPITQAGSLRNRIVTIVIYGFRYDSTWVSFGSFVAPCLALIRFHRIFIVFQTLAFRFIKFTSTNMAEKKKRSRFLDSAREHTRNLDPTMQFDCFHFSQINQSNVIWIHASLLLLHRFTVMYVCVLNQLDRILFSIGTTNHQIGQRPASIECAVHWNYARRIFSGWVSGMLLNWAYYDLLMGSIRWAYSIRMLSTLLCGAQRTWSTMITAAVTNHATLPYRFSWYKNERKYNDFDEEDRILFLLWRARALPHWFRLAIDRETDTIGWNFYLLLFWLEKCENTFSNQFKKFNHSDLRECCAEQRRK